MATKYISLIVILAIFLFFVILLTVLSLKYQKKHEPYREIRDNYFAQYEALKKENQVKLTVVETDVNLPNDEAFYLIKRGLNYYEQDLKVSKNQRKQAIREFELDYEFIEQKRNYSLSNRVERFYRENLVADLFVTNKRILLKTENQIQEIKFYEIEQIAPTIISLKKSTFLGIIIYTKEKLYRIKDNDLNDLLVMQTLWNEFIGGQKND